MRGALAIVTTCGEMRWTRRQRLTSAAFAYGEVDWVRRPDAGVKSEGGESCSRAMVSRKAGSPGRSRISRKAVAQGRPDASAKPVCSWAAFSVANSLRDRGCGAHPVFPAPSHFEGKVFLQNSGRIAPRERSLLSSPAKAGDPVFRDADDRIEKPRRTGSPLGSRDKCNTC